MPALFWSRTCAVVSVAIALLCIAAPLHAGGAKVEELQVELKHKVLAKVSAVALVSVYGDYKVRGRKVLEFPGDYTPLELIAQEKTVMLKQLLQRPEFLPFPLVDEGTATRAPAYREIIRERLAESTQPEAEDVVYAVAGLFGSKAKSENAKLEDAGMTVVDYSRKGFFVPENLGVYAVPSLDLRVRTFGAATKAREKMFQEMGADGILVASVEFAALGSGGNVFGKESGRVTAALKGVLLMPDGSMPFTFYVLGVSDKETLFRSPNAGMFEQKKEFVQDAAVQMSADAWDSAFAALQTRMSEVSAKLTR